MRILAIRVLLAAVNRLLSESQLYAVSSTLTLKPWYALQRLLHNLTGKRWMMMAVEDNTRRIMSRHTHNAYARHVPAIWRTPAICERDALYSADHWSLLPSPCMVRRLCV